MFGIFIQIGYQSLNCNNSNHFSSPYVEYMGILHALMVVKCWKVVMVVSIHYNQFGQIPWFFIIKGEQ
jgi:hypothetical protein